MNLCSILVLLAFSVLSPITLAQHPDVPHPFTVDDLFGMQEVSDAQISPDGQFILYTVNSTNLKEDKTSERIWMVPTAGGDAIPLTADGPSSSHPRWSHDGKFIAFLSEREEGKTQVYLLNRLGGEAQRLTETPQNVETFCWSPDGTRLVLVLRDPTEEELEAAADKNNDSDDKAAKKAKSQKPWVIDRLLFKADTIGYLDHHRTHLYVFDIAAKSLKQITYGDFDDSEPLWSPDGKLIAFSSNRTQPDPDETYDDEIWTVVADNTDKGATGVTQITRKPGEHHSPAWSPDGKWIVYTTKLDPSLFEYATKHIALSPAAGGEEKVYTGALDRMSTEPRFAPDGKSVYFIADDDGTQVLAQLTLADSKITLPMGGRVMLDSYSFSNDGTLAASVSTPERPAEIYTAPGGKLTRITHVNDAWAGRLRWSQAEYVSFKSKDGTTVHGYLYKPVDYVAGKKYPTIVRPHGGPVWSYYAEYEDIAQLLASNGYLVLLPNPRGSSGYGEDFCKAIFADWGNKDFDDDMAFVDYAIAQGIADPDKLGVGGWSYGGISTDFIIGKTKRFKAAISGAGAGEFTSMWGHDQYVKEYITELGFPWEHREAWDKVSPFYNLKNITTPTLFVGGNIDWNVPILGGEQMYQSLKALGRETELVVYPNEYHEFKTPSHIKDCNERFLAWYAHYVKADGTPARPKSDKAFN
ncbi:MAG TPA: S9 family peptidase [Candidatus Acidoferrum sp.]|nr:S9 family peptidase [Candidatus Acidoferrum sp.]